VWKAYNDILVLIGKDQYVFKNTSGRVSRHHPQYPHKHETHKFSEAKNMIKVAVGMRRSGKTYFLYQTIRELISEGIPLDRILFINFEDARLQPIDPKKMGELIDGWYTLYPDNHNPYCYVFFYEIQNVENWPPVLRRLLDTKNIQVYVTGSSAKLLSTEIATSLRGRSFHRNFTL
jgi:predicted AAA+ superfamily ATPase